MNQSKNKMETDLGACPIIQVNKDGLSKKKEPKQSTEKNIKGREISIIYSTKNNTSSESSFPSLSDDLCLLFQIFKELLKNHPSEDFSYDSFIYQLKKYSSDHKPTYVNPGNNEEHSPRYEKFLKLKQLIEHKYKEHRSLSYFSSRLNTSTRNLHDISKSYTGKSVKQLLKDRIILESKRLLTFTHISVKEISFELGFEDPAYFSRVFTKHVRKSPSEFRNNLLRKRTKNQNIPTPIRHLELKETDSLKLYVKK